MEHVIQRNCGILISEGFQVPAQSILSCTLLCPSRPLPNLLSHLIPLVSYVLHDIMAHGPPSGFDVTRSAVRIRVTLLVLACKITMAFTFGETVTQRTRSRPTDLR